VHCLKNSFVLLSTVVNNRQYFSFAQHLCCDMLYGITAILSFSHYCIGHIFLHYRLILCEAVFGLLLCGLGATA